MGDLGSIPGLGRFPGEGKDYPLQYSGLENSKDCRVHGVSKSQTRLNDFHFTFSIYSLLAFFGIILIFFLIEAYKIYNIVLVSGAQHGQTILPENWWVFKAQN